MESLASRERLIENPGDKIWWLDGGRGGGGLYSRESKCSLPGRLKFARISAASVSVFPRVISTTFVLSANESAASRDLLAFILELADLDRIWVRDLDRLPDEFASFVFLFTDGKIITGSGCSAPSACSAMSESVTEPTTTDWAFPSATPLTEPQTFSNAFFSFCFNNIFLTSSCACIRLVDIASLPLVFCAPQNAIAFL